MLKFLIFKSLKFYQNKCFSIIYVFKKIGVRFGFLFYVSFFLLQSLFLPLCGVV